MSRRDRLLASFRRNDPGTAAVEPMLITMRMAVAAIAAAAALRPTLRTAFEGIGTHLGTRVAGTAATP